MSTSEYRVGSAETREKARELAHEYEALLRQAGLTHAWSVAVQGVQRDRWDVVLIRLDAVNSADKSLYSVLSARDPGR